jgi:hypothetical protein
MLGTTRTRVSFFMNRYGAALHSLRRRLERRSAHSQFAAECRFARLVCASRSLRLTILLTKPTVVATYKSTYDSVYHGEHRARTIFVDGYLC